MDKLYDVLLYLVQHAPFSPADRAAAETVLRDHFGIEDQAASDATPAPAAPAAFSPPAG